MKNLAVVGYGGMGDWHCSFAQKSDVVKLKGIYDIKQERIDLAQSRNISVYDSFEDVLMDQEIDLVTIAVPNDQHKNLAIECMNHGKHVIVEKPVTLSSTDLQAMIDAANKNNVVFSVHQNRRWDEDFLSVKEVFTSGILGRVIDIESRVHGSNGIPGDWRKEKKYGGGMMLDWGVHLIDQMLMMVPGRIKTIYCLLNHVTNNEVDDGFKLLLLFENGVRAHIEVGTNNYISLPRWYVNGTEGTMQIDDWAMNGRITKRILEYDKDIVPVRTAAGLTKTMAPRSNSTIQTTDIPKNVADVHDYYRNFANAIDKKEMQIVTHEQMLRVMKVMEAAFESDRLKQPVDFE